MTKLLSWERALYRHLKPVSARLTPAVIVILHILAVLSLLFYMRRVGTILLLVQFVCFILLLALNYRAIRSVRLAAFLAADVLAVLISVLLHPGYGVALTYLGTVIAVVIFRNIALSRRIYTVIHLISAIGLTYMLGMTTFTYTPFLQMLGNEINRNFCGILAVMCLLHWLCAFDMMRIKPYYRLLGQALGVILGVSYVLQFQCRSSMLALAVVFALCICKWRAFSPRMQRMATVTVLITCLTFPFLYLAMYRRMPDVLILGKPLFSGREEIWLNVLRLFKEKPIFGYGTTVNEYTHHAMLHVALCLGIVAVIGWIVIHCFPCRIEGPYTARRLAQFAYLGGLFISFFEAFPFNHYAYIFFLSFLLSAVRTEGGEGAP